MEDNPWWEDSPAFLEPRWRPAISINGCNAWELAQAVPGIGIVLSNRIVNESKKLWFHNWEDLYRRVHGIGPRLIEKMKRYRVIIHPRLVYFRERDPLGNLNCLEHIKNKF